MKKTALILLVCLHGLVGFAQSEVENDLPLNDSLYQALPESNMLLFGDSNYGAAPQTAHSLRPYCPVPVAQKQAIGGLSWTVAITQTMTIQWAQTNGWNAGQIQSQALSYSFLYDLLPKAAPNSCKLSRDWIQQTKHLLQDIGTVRIMDYNPKTIDCSSRPADQLLRQARQYSVRSFDRLFEVSSTDDGMSLGGKLFKIRRCLERNHPVVLCLQVDEAFQQLRKDTWIPSTDPKRYYLQTVVVIGYDENRKAFEIMNSQGTTWGNGGFAWIRYSDIVRAKYGFEIITKPPKPQATTLARRPSSPSYSVTRPASVIKPAKPATEDNEGASRLTGQLVLNEVVGYDQYKTVPLSYQSAGYYQPGKTYPVSSQFQLVSQQAQEGSYVYVFSVDPKGKAEVHYPYQWNAQDPSQYGMGIVTLSPVVPEAKSQVVIPQPRITYDERGKMIRTERALSKEAAGADWLVVLYSDRRLDNELNDLVGQLNRHNRDFIPRFKDVFGNRLVAEKDIQYSPNGFSARTQKGYIIPQIIKLEAQ